MFHRVNTIATCQRGVERTGIFLLISFLELSRVIGGKGDNSPLGVERSVTYSSSKLPSKKLQLTQRLTIAIAVSSVKH